MDTLLFSYLHPIYRISHPMIIHIGKIIKDTLKSKMMDVTEFSKRINYTRGNAYKIFNKPSIDTDLLVKISKVLGENLFFRYLTNEEIAEYKNSKVKAAELVNAMRELKDAINVLNKEKKGRKKKIKQK